MQSEVKGYFLTPDGQVKKGIASISEGKIVRCEFDIDSNQAEREDEGVIVPGFIDVHVHGGGGSDVMDATPEALDKISATHGAKGTTAWLATTVTQSTMNTDRAIDAVVAYMKSDRNGKAGAQVVGIHLEGPFLNPKLRGAHREDFVCLPDKAQFIQWCERAEGTIKMITLAPELEGAEELIREAVRRGIVVSAGHSDATWADMEKATALGVSHVTHLFNAMRPLHHREPGIIAYTLQHSALTADIIVDGIHLHRGIVDLALANKGADKLLLITDAMRAACIGDGEYGIDGFQVTVRNGEARIHDGTLAGSLLTLDEAFRRMVQLHDVSMADASRMASTNPAKLLQLEAIRGSVAEGMKADLVCLRRDGAVSWTMVNGRFVYRSPE
ncbi:N-acetylglucosamine-6-phosphate deacetylase [Cohnella herbarum]|uniref:N-acetylglucosamine-6-phosphate deacetylase n=1 Tax=Cohnella herbarum TaxID=2728023 RepID=A0A7Z2VMY8_9BACL|nr:N-acetylglucosamine-6-phosphate deacetylase [Cohnella herbarum]QJD85915.1 N-acetylglucosamine-6-phosphate deacetylase [Cohnella herbarum]